MIGYSQNSRFKEIPEVVEDWLAADYDNQIPKLGLLKKISKDRITTDFFKNFDHLKMLFSYIFRPTEIKYSQVVRIFSTLKYNFF